MKSDTRTDLEQVLAPYGRGARSRVGRLAIRRAATRRARGRQHPRRLHSADVVELYARGSDRWVQALGDRSG